MMIIKVDNIKFAKTFIKRLKGYMFHRRPQTNEVLIIDPCNQIHTFNMKFDIDVLYLDNDYRVIHKHLALKPGKILPCVKNATCVVEAKTGLFESIKEGELIRFEL